MEPRTEGGAAVLVEIGEGYPDAVVKVLGVPDWAVFFEQLENLFQDYLRVGGSGCVLQLETSADDFGSCGMLQVQDSSSVWFLFLDRSFSAAK